MQKIDMKTREALFDKLQKGAHVASFPLVHRATVVTFTRISIVILGNGEDRSIGLLPHPLLNCLDADSQYIGIGQAQLGVLTHSFAIYLGVVLRVLFEIFLYAVMQSSRHKPVEGVIHG